MKKALLLLLLPLIIFSQKKETIKLKFPLKDYSGTTKSLEVIDLRKNKTIDQIVFRGNYYKFTFPTDDASKDIEDWFYRNNENRKKGVNDLVLLIEDLNISNQVREKEIFGVYDMKFSTFIKKENGYQLLKRYDNVIALNSKEPGNIPDIFVENTQKVLQKLMFDSYRATPHKTLISEENLYNYNEILKNELPAFTNLDLKDGIYLDYESFFKQTPEADFKIVKDGDRVQKAVNSKDEKISSRKIYIYVENGKAFKNTQSGFLEMFNDQRGFFIKANKYMLFPEEISTSSYYFLFGGAVIGAIGTSIEFSIKYKNALNGDKDPIYIDFLNGEFSFSQ